MDETSLNANGNNDDASDEEAQKWYLGELIGKINLLWKRAFGPSNDWCAQHGYGRPLRGRSPLRVHALTPLPSPRKHSPVRQGYRRPKPSDLDSTCPGGFVQKCTDFYCTRLCSMICILFAVSNMCSFYFSTGQAMVMMTMSVIILYHLQMIKLSHLCLAMIMMFNVMLMISTHDMGLVAITFMHVCVIAIMHIVH